MSGIRKSSIAGVVALGGLVLLTGLLNWESGDPTRLLVYLLVALAGSALKVRLPKITVTMSLSFVFILIGIVELSFSETLLIGCTGTVLQCVWRTRTRVRAVRVLFSVAVIALAVGAGYFTYHCPAAQNLGNSLPLLLPLAASVFFLVNTVPVAAIVSLDERRPLGEVWRGCYFWLFPYYVGGAAFVGLIHVAGRAVGWKASLLLLPLTYLLYYFYRLCLDRREREL